MSTIDKTQPQLGKAPPPGKKTATAEHPGRATRETIESVIIAIILAFLFRTFEAEAFVIPTGSMAPTLQGAHRDVACPQCGYRYRTGASQEAEGRAEVAATVCPICRFPHVVDPLRDPNEKTFTGDRILVSKFAYQIDDPERWDPIVFKFPGNPKQNYIKRLVGLPDEKGRIYHGDVYATPAGGDQEFILRKPPHKLVAMLQVVDDANYIAPALVNAKWPSRWQTWTPPGSASPARWEMSEDHRSFTTDGQGTLSWLRYKHLVPYERDWEDIAQGRLPADMKNRDGMLITDFYTYNVHYYLPDTEFAAEITASPEDYERYVRQEAVSNDHNRMSAMPRRVLGYHWVGDLAVETNVNITSQAGEVLLNLVEGGVHYTCRIDVATGIAKMEIDGGKTPFVDVNRKETQFPEATTALRGPGNHHLRLSNCDDEMLLWVDGRVVAFNVPTTYASRPDNQPRASASDPGDLAPAGIGTNGAAFTISGMRVLRDIYYIASDGGDNVDYRHLGAGAVDDLTQVFTTPSTWETTDLFKSRRELLWETKADQFYPLGDNSPASQDARSWANDPRGVNGEFFTAPKYVERDLLIGKALVIYWPHAWNRPVPFTPNVQRMGIIR